LFRHEATSEGKKALSERREKRREEKRREEMMSFRNKKRVAFLF